LAIIKTLPDHIARRIAAGEVVERPASVVKELLENAADAGARCIHIATTGGGEVLIEVRDDGQGMPPDDVRMAPRNFSTSKIGDADDLQHIETYGFRGEALASISAVSRFELVSADSQTGSGWRLATEGKGAIADQPAPHERGTTVRVRDLFFNTPARKRFLKSPVTERRRILEAILAFGLIQPSVELHYRDDGRDVLDLLAASSWRERVAAVLGYDVMKHMVQTTHESDAMKIRGFVSLPTLTRSNRTQQFFFVNGRPVREKTLVHALQDGYRGVLAPRRFPVAVLALDAPTEHVDVNVHPTKLEVRVREERRLFALVRQSVKLALSGRAEENLAVSLSRPVVAEGSGAGESLDSGASPLAPDNNAEHPGAKVIELQQRIRDAWGIYGTRPGSVPSHPNPQLSLRADSAEPDEGETTRVAVESIRRRAEAEDGLFWQFNNSYIFIQVRGGLVVIDQHAAHERIIYDNTRKQIEGQAPPSQQILFSIHIELSLAELEVFRSERETFRKLGFDLEPFGGTSILVRGYPLGIKNWE